MKKGARSAAKGSRARESATRPAGVGPEYVEARLKGAFATLRLMRCDELRWLADERSSMPPTLPNPTEGYGYEDSGSRPPRPAPETISEMDEALGWLWWIGGRVRLIVTARCAGARWRAVQRRAHLGRHQCRRLYNGGLAAIAGRLNGAGDDMLLTDPPNAP